MIFQAPIFNRCSKKTHNVKAFNALYSAILEDLAFHSLWLAGLVWVRVPPSPPKKRCDVFFYLDLLKRCHMDPNGSVTGCQFIILVRVSLASHYSNFNTWHIIRQFPSTKLSPQVATLRFPGLTSDVPPRFLQRLLEGEGSREFRRPDPSCRDPGTAERSQHDMFLRKRAWLGGSWEVKLSAGILGGYIVFEPKNPNKIIGIWWNFRGKEHNGSFHVAPFFC